MTRPRKPPTEEKAPLQLLQPPETVRTRIDERIRKGKELINAPINSPDILERVKNEYWKWSAYNAEMLRQVATNDELSAEYSWWAGVGIGADLTFIGEVEELHKDIHKKIQRLESIAERLELLPVSDETRARSTQSAREVASFPNSVFIVHGHDGEAREAVARFVERLGFHVVVLHEQSDKGMTVIEKLEANSAVGFAVVLLTPDDEGREVGSKEPLSPRARQNVVLELGYFVGKLGRERVCAIYRGVEIPSDYLGVLYIPLDEGGAWKLRLARELKAAGFAVDMNRAV